MKNPPIDPWLLEFNNILNESNSIYRNATRQLGVPECTFWILYSLRAEDPPLTQAQLCQLILQPKQTINSALKNLEEEEYITLVPGNDRRTREIQLTERGAALAERTADQMVLAEEQALAGLEPEERAIFLRCYRKLNKLMLHAISQWEK